MSEDELKKALLEREGTAQPGEELRVLSDLIQYEQRRVRNLGRYSLAAWTGWGMCLALMLLLPVWMARPAGAPVELAEPSVLLSMLKNAMSLALVVGAMLLPIVGTVLLILYVFASRSPMARSWFATRSSTAR